MMKLKRGAVYLIRGGHILRYHGPWGAKTIEAAEGNPQPTGRGLAFQSIESPLDLPAVGVSIAIEDVKAEVTKDDAHWIRERLAQCLARDIFSEAQSMAALLAELGEK